MTDGRTTAMDLIKTMSNAERDEVMRAGVAPRFEDLVGWEFAGTNTPPITALIGIRKFKKGFYEGAPLVSGGPEPFIQGYNVKVEQNGIGQPHNARPSEEAPKRHDFYRVCAITDGMQHDRYPNAMLLHYGFGGNGASPGGWLRDYLVQVHPDDRDLLLGRAYAAPFGGRGFSVSFFVLERNNPHDFNG